MDAVLGSLADTRTTADGATPTPVIRTPVPTKSLNVVSALALNHHLLSTKIGGQSNLQTRNIHRQPLICERQAVMLTPLSEVFLILLSTFIPAVLQPSKHSCICAMAKTNSDFPLTQVTANLPYHTQEGIQNSQAEKSQLMKPESLHAFLVILRLLTRKTRISLFSLCNPISCPRY